MCGCLMSRCGPKWSCPKVKHAYPRLQGVITQNIDSLHQDGGVVFEKAEPFEV